MTALSTRITRLEQSRPERPVKLLFVKEHDARTDLEALYPDHRLILFICDK